MFMMIPAPLRQFRTWSMILLIADGLLNLAGVAINAMSDAHYISAATFGLVNIAFGFAIGAVRLIKQQVTATTDEKKELIAHAIEQPVKPGQRDVTAVIVQADKPAPPSPAENTERLKTFIEMTTQRMVEKALTEAAQTKVKKRRKHHVAPVTVDAP